MLWKHLKQMSGKKHSNMLEKLSNLTQSMLMHGESYQMQAFRDCENNPHSNKQHHLYQQPRKLWPYNLMTWQCGFVADVFYPTNLDCTLTHFNGGKMLDIKLLRKLRQS